MWAAVQLPYNETYKLVLLDSVHAGHYDDDKTWHTDVTCGDGKKVTEAVFPPDAPHNSPIYPVPREGSQQNNWEPSMEPIEPRYEGDDLAGAYGSGNRDEQEQTFDADHER